MNLNSKNQSDYKIAMGQRIRLQRKKRKFTQENMAEFLDISVKHYSEVERGITGLSVEKLIELSNIFGTSLDYLIKGIETNSTVPSPLIALYTQCPPEKIPHLMDLLQNLSKLIQKE